MKNKSNYFGIAIIVINLILIADIIAAAVINQNDVNGSNNISATVIFYAIFTVLQIPPLALFYIKRFNSSVELNATLALWFGLASILKIGTMFFLELAFDVTANGYGITRFGANVYVVYIYLASAVLLLAAEVTFAVLKCLENKNRIIN